VPVVVRRQKTATLGAVFGVFSTGPPARGLLNSFLVLVLGFDGFEPLRKSSLGSHAASDHNYFLLSS
jgi:hypothetical protein